MDRSQSRPVVTDLYEFVDDRPLGGGSYGQVRPSARNCEVPLVGAPDCVGAGFSDAKPRNRGRGGG